MDTMHSIERLDNRSSYRIPRAAMAMKKNALLSIARPQGCRIDCLEGTLWITQDGDPRDIVLMAGEYHVADRCPRLIVQALESGVVRVVGRGSPMPARADGRPAASARTASA